MTTIHFNTGRLYQQHGQRITARIQPDCTILFMDHSRGIAGKLRGTVEVFPDGEFQFVNQSREISSRKVNFQHLVRELAEFVMKLYDRLQYDTDPEALNLTYDHTQEHLFRI